MNEEETRKRNCDIWSKKKRKMMTRGKESFWTKKRQHANEESGIPNEANDMLMETSTYQNEKRMDRWRELRNNVRPSCHMGSGWATWWEGNGLPQVTPLAADNELRS